MKQGNLPDLWERLKEWLRNRLDVFYKPTVPASRHLPEEPIINPRHTSSQVQVITPYRYESSRQRALRRRVRQHDYINVRPVRTYVVEGGER